MPLVCPVPVSYGISGRASIRPGHLTIIIARRVGISLG